MSVTSSPDHTPHRELRDAILRHVRYTLARTDGLLPARSLLKPVSLAVRDLLVDRMLDTEQRYREADAKRLYYLSMEHLPGRFLGDNLCNLRLTGVCREILAEFGAELDDVLDQEPDPGLGNGGLGRLAACFMESLATLGLPGFGYGIDYEYGLFRQEITNGYQRERPDRWKEQGTPGLIERVDEPTLIPIYGGVEDTRDSQGVRRRVWVDYKAVIGVPNDLPVAGYGGRTVNYVRLFAARSSEEFDLEVFNQGDYIRAVEAKIAYENISRVLYPSDNVSRGKELRLLQEYFLVACAIRDIVRRYRHEHRNFDDLPAKVAIQMNDTHPALAVAELMRVLVDGYEIEWKRAWEMTEATLAYTNHTLLPEALEKWPVSLLQYVLPRHMEIIYLINEQLLAEVTRSWPDDAGRLARVSLIEEGQEKQVRMANLAVVGSHSVNGVSEMHTDLLKSSLFADFHQLWPQKFNNKTNGVAPRRWLLKANPELAALLTQAVGNDSWIADLARLRAVEVFADDVGLQSDFVRIKRDNKTKLAAFIRQKTGLVVNVDSIFDVHIKRIHQYKRQLLNVLRIIREYLCLVDEGGEVLVPRTYIFAGKAAPGYWAAKQIIKLIHNVARTINGDPRVRDRMRVVFLPDYKVSLAELIIPAADLSQQIATAGMEASGTGNMKLAMNGALTICTYDGANIELIEEVGAENIYVFGLRVSDIVALRQNGYSPRQDYQGNPGIANVVNSLDSDRFSVDEPGLFKWIYDQLLNGDPYFHLADLASYLEASASAERDYTEVRTWARKSILNVARSGKFSADRAVSEYARDIWGLTPITPPAAVPAQSLASPALKA